MKVKVYLSARISVDAHHWNNAVEALLDDRLEMFMPQNCNPWNKDHREFPKQVYDIDLKAMEDSDIGLLLPPYGRDCAWEVGWYANCHKPLVVYTEHDNEWLRDWMVKGGLDQVITSEQWLFDIFKNDPIIHNKCILMSSRDQISDTLIEIHNQANKI